MQMVASVADGKLTYRDFVKFPDDGKRHELIDGVHYVAASRLDPHQVVVGNLYFHLRSHLDGHPGGRVFLSPLTSCFRCSTLSCPTCSSSPKHAGTS
jgi:hypothetical protein